MNLPAEYHHTTDPAGGKHRRTVLPIDATDRQSNSEFMRFFSAFGFEIVPAGDAEGAVLT